MNDYNLIPSFNEFRMMNESYLYEKSNMGGITSSEDVDALSDTELKKSFAYKATIGAYERYFNSFASYNEKKHLNAIRDAYKNAIKASKKTQSKFTVKNYVKAVEKMADNYDKFQTLTDPKEKAAFKRKYEMIPRDAATKLLKPVTGKHTNALDRIAAGFTALALSTVQKAKRPRKASTTAVEESYLYESKGASEKQLEKMLSVDLLPAKEAKKMSQDALYKHYFPKKKVTETGAYLATVDYFKKHFGKNFDSNKFKGLVQSDLITAYKRAKRLLNSGKIQKLNDYKTNWLADLDILTNNHDKVELERMEKRQKKMEKKFESLSLYEKRRSKRTSTRYIPRDIAEKIEKAKKVNVVDAIAIPMIIGTLNNELQRFRTNESYLYEKRIVTDTEIIVCDRGTWKPFNAGRNESDAKENAKRLAKLAIKGGKTGKYAPEVKGLSVILLDIYGDNDKGEDFEEHYLVWCNEDGPDDMMSDNDKAGAEACIQYLKRKRKMPAMIRIDD